MCCLLRLVYIRLLCLLTVVVCMLQDRLCRGAPWRRAACECTVRHIPSAFLFKQSATRSSLTVSFSVCASCCSGLLCKQDLVKSFNAQLGKAVARVQKIQETLEKCDADHVCSYSSFFVSLLLLLLLFLGGGGLLRLKIQECSVCACFGLFVCASRLRARVVFIYGCWFLTCDLTFSFPFCRMVLSR